MEKRKILAFTYRDLNGTGGVETYLNNLASCFDLSRFDLSFLVPELSSEKQVESSWIYASFVKCFTYNRAPKQIRNFFRFLNPFLRLLDLCNNIRILLRKSLPDLIITREYMTAIASRIILRDTAILFLPGSLAALDISYDGAEADGSALYRISSRLQRYSIAILEYASFLCSTKVIVSSNLLKREIHNRYRIRHSKIEKMPIGVALRNFQPKYNHDTISSRRRKIILSVSRLSKSKNIHRILEIANFLDDGYIWMIVGNGNEYENLKREINTRRLSKKVFLLGERKDPLKYYKLCDVFVHLSYYENFGQVLLEAMICGKPPIVLDPNLPGVNTASGEIIVDGYNGYLVDSDPQEIANKIIQVSERGTYISDNCMEFVRENYTFEGHLEGLYKMIDSVLCVESEDHEQQDKRYNPHLQRG